ncbi:hypothetical protein COEREDRAFT_88637 [Coemansia reversa NRRL 1564]|uniref:Uncharacterized protein n=1 Tax=Coemansia reversa (strain ATCC 12441 / NRRL 1564) TaxID=763665 RepID=A0A2G5B6C3_COERN|nr:hypothetical protein COEREDRAFT_88637 [Coemansia reversa NRRL 1564]|eukprot:PIA14542.1 hypothetical protein COEREDRAFT_88637 [Coemansia reversa NRRL 1564]
MSGYMPTLNISSAANIAIPVTNVPAVGADTISKSSTAEVVNESSSDDNNSVQVQVVSDQDTETECIDLISSEDDLEMDQSSSEYGSTDSRPIDDYMMDTDQPLHQGLDTDDENEVWSDTELTRLGTQATSPIMADGSIRGSVFGLIRPLTQREELSSEEDEEMDEDEEMENEVNADEEVISGKLEHNISDTEALMTANISTQTDVRNVTNSVVTTRTDSSDVVTQTESENKVMTG